MRKISLIAALVSVLAISTLAACDDGSAFNPPADQSTFDNSVTELPADECPQGPRKYPCN